MEHRRLRAGRLALAAVVTTTAVVVPLATLAQPAGASTLDVAPAGTILITMRGNGHGHGMSQYGARGAAIAGKSYSSIVSFYYPGTTLTTLSPSVIRVRISGSGSTVTVAADSAMTVSGRAAALPTSGVAKYRLVTNSASGLTLQQLPTASRTWRNYLTGLPNRTAFHRANAATRVFDGGRGGASSSYYGYVSAVRNRMTGTTGGVFTVNRVSLDDYAAGVTPREVPASWEKQAVYAQTVAARSYGRYAVEHADRGSDYDLCDTSSCQVYGGHVRYDPRGAHLYRDLPSAAAATSNKVLRYKGKTIFAQFSASHGGWAVAGGQPYLVTKRDIYDTSRSGDPYLDYTRTVTARSVASYYGLAVLTKIVVSTRDGNGAWGGRAISGYVQGTDHAGRKVTVKTSGLGLQYALGIGTTWFWLAKA